MHVLQDRTYLSSSTLYLSSVIFLIKDCLTTPRGKSGCVQGLYVIKKQIEPVCIHLSNRNLPQCMVPTIMWTLAGVYVYVVSEYHKLMSSVASKGRRINHPCLWCSTRVGLTGGDIHLFHSRVLFTVLALTLPWTQ